MRTRVFNSELKQILVIELVLLVLSKQSLFIMTPMLLVLNHTRQLFSLWCFPPRRGGGVYLSAPPDLGFRGR
jgi:hypothetical protein